MDCCFDFGVGLATHVSPPNHLALKIIINFLIVMLKKKRPCDGEKSMAPEGQTIGPSSTSGGLWVMNQCTPLPRRVGSPGATLRKLLTISFNLESFWQSIWSICNPQRGFS